MKTLLQDRKNTLFNQPRNIASTPDPWMPTRDFQIKAALSVFLIAIVTTGYFVFFNKDEQSKTLAQLQAEGIDSDNDGLKDWEEALWQTDPNNPDTDGDGTPDGAEVSANRDPLRPGPNDQVGREQIVALYDYESDLETARGSRLNQTRNLAQSLLPRVLLLSSKDNLTQSDLEEVVTPIELSTLLSTQYRPAFSVSDLDTKETTNENKVQYATKMEEIMNQYQDLDSDEISEFASYLENENEAGIVGLRSTALRYETIARSLLATPVPAVVSSEHLALVNGFNSLSGSLERLSNYYSDPIAALVGLKRYKDTAPQIVESVSSIAQKLTS